MEVQISIKEDKVGKAYFRVCVEKDDDTGFVKYLNGEELLQVLNPSMQKSKAQIIPGELPAGYLDGKFTEDGSFWVKFYVPAGKHAFALKKLDKDKKQFVRPYLIPYPPLIFEVKAEKENGISKGVSGRVCCVKGSFRQVKRSYYDNLLETFGYPFGNVDATGSICMGSIHPKIDVVKDAQQFTDAFFAGVTNEDYIHSYPHTTTDMAQCELAEYLEEKQEFPTELLVEKQFQFMNRYV